MAEPVSYTRDNAWIVRNIKRLVTKQTTKTQLEQRIRNLQRRVEDLRIDIQYLEGVDEVYEGVVLRVNDDLGYDKRRWLGVGAVADEIQRTATAYDAASAKGPRRVAIKIEYRSDGFPYWKDEFCGFGWTWSEAEQIVRDWVAKGKRP